MHQNLGACLNKLGVIADTQYSQHENQLNYAGTRMRYYRDSLKHLENAVNYWVENEMDSIIHLGDIMDGYCHQGGYRDVAEAEYLDVMKPIDRANIPVHYCVGNHELYNYSRKELWETKFMDEARRHIQPSFITAHEDPIIYYSFKPCRGYRIIIVDTFEISIMGVDKDSESYKSAYQLIKLWNPNANWNDHRNLERPYLVAYNGAISEKQLAWIEQELKDAQRLDEKVIIMGHVPACPGFLRSPASILWNYDEFLSMLRSYSSTVLAMLTGHTHMTGVWMDPQSEHGTIHITMEGVLETPLSDTSHSVLQLYENGIVITGNSTMDSITLLKKS